MADEREHAAEQAVLAACLMDNEAIRVADDMLRPEDFASPAHRRIYAAILELFHRNEAVDTLMVAHEVGADLGMVGGKNYLAELIDAVPTAANVRYHAKLVQAALQQRQRGARGRIAERTKEVATQVQTFLSAPPSQFIRYPWPALDALMGGMLPGEVHYVGGFSGNGKTLFMLSLALAWAELGRGVYYMGLETSPMILLTQLFCMKHGLSSAEVLTGRAWHRADWETVVLPDLKKAALTFQEPIYLAPAPRIDLPALREAFEEADGMDTQILMVDHVDHLGTGDGRSSYEEMRAVNNALLEYAQASGMLVIASTQFNLEAVKHDPLDKYLPPREHYVLMGNHKRTVATSMLGLYRPLKPNLSADELKGVRAKTVDPRDLLEPWAMAVSCMKHRKDGAQEGKKALLNTHGYRVTDLPERDRYAITARGGLKAI